MSVTITIFTTAGWVGERAREVVDRERRACPRDEEAARTAEGVGGAGEGEDQGMGMAKMMMMTMMIMMMRSR